MNDFEVLILTVLVLFLVSVTLGVLMMLSWWCRWLLVTSDLLVMYTWCCAIDECDDLILVNVMMLITLMQLIVFGIFVTSGW